jgi:hypothetical protein
MELEEQFSKFKVGAPLRSGSKPRSAERSPNNLGQRVVDTSNRKESGGSRLYWPRMKENDNSSGVGRRVFSTQSLHPASDQYSQSRSLNRGGESVSFGQIQALEN